MTEGKRHSISFIGMGAISTDVVGHLLRNNHRVYRVSALLREQSAARSCVPSQCTVLDSLQDLAHFDPDLVVEAAGHGAVREYVPSVLALGKSVLITSIGALADESLLNELIAIARHNGARICLPSGALAGLDYVRAASSASDLRVSYESRKPPAAWNSELKDLSVGQSGLGSPITLFKGSAREAAKNYPANLNVAAALGLSASGFDKLDVSVIVDPEVSSNVHIVRCESEYGTMEVRQSNIPSKTQPKTSRLVVGSIIAAISSYFSTIQFC